MAFPSSPSNNQTATVNGIVYVYNSTKTAWIRSALTPGNNTVNAISIISNTSSTSTTSGALIVTGGVGVGGNIYVGGTLNAATSLSVVGGIVSGNLTTSVVTATTVSATTITGTISTAAQTSITSLGTLTGLTAGNTQIYSLGIGTPASATQGEIRATNNITSYYSDERLKTKLGTIENALDKVDQLTGFYYEANEAAQELGFAKRREVGISAQATQTVLPEIVKAAPISDKYLTVQYERFAPLLIEAIKELRQEVNAIKRQLGS